MHLRFLHTSFGSPPNSTRTSRAPHARPSHPPAPPTPTMHHFDLPPIDKHLPLHPNPTDHHNAVITNSITTTSTSATTTITTNTAFGPPATADSHSHSQSHDPPSSLTKHYHLADNTLPSHPPQQTNDIPPNADYDNYHYDRNAALQSWNATLRKSFLSRRTPFHDGQGKGDGAYESNSITAPTPPHSSSASIAVDLPPLPPSSAAAMEDTHFDTGTDASFPSTAAQTPVAGDAEGSTGNARTPSPLFLPRHTNHSLDSVGVLQLGDGSQHQQHQHQQYQQHNPFPGASSSDRATAAGLFLRDGDHHHNNNNHINTNANVGSASSGDDELLSVTAIALADVLRGDERAPAAYDANSRRFESVLDLDMQRAKPGVGVNVGHSPSSSSSSPSTSRTTQAGGPSTTTTHHHHHHHRHHLRRRRHSSRKRRDTLEAMRATDPSTGVDGVDDDVDMDDVWDKFVKTMADCGPLARPDHRTVVIALLRATVADLGIRTLIPWYTDTVAHLTPGAPAQTPFNSAPYPPMHLREPGANTYSSAAYSFSAPLRGAPPAQSESGGEEEDGNDDEEGRHHDERQRQQQQELTSTVIEPASRDGGRNNNIAVHTLANPQRAMSDHNVTTVFLLGVGGVSASDGKESRMKRLKRAKARFLKRAILVVSGYSPTSGGGGGGGRHGLRQHHRNVAELKHKYSDVIDMQVMLSFALTVVVVHAALARCGCDITLQTPYTTSKNGVSYIHTGVPAAHSSASGSGSAATSGRRISLCDYTHHHSSRHKHISELDGHQQQQWQETNAVTAADFNVRVTYYGAKIAFAVSFKDDAPCQVSFHHPGILAARHATRFAELVGEVRSLVETFERKVLVWECARRAATASEAEHDRVQRFQR